MLYQEKINGAISRSKSDCFDALKKTTKNLVIMSSGL